MPEPATSQPAKKKGTLKVAIVLLIFAGCCGVSIAMLLWINRSSGLNAPVTTVSLVAIGLAFVVCLIQWRDQTFAVDLADQAARAEQQRADNPKDPEKAWTAARLTQELYYKRNLNQTSQIFYIAVATMIAGFLLIYWASYRSLQDHAILTTSIVAAASGILTEFIAATFMVIYKSSMAQAGEYMKILERVNNVGMALQILANLPEESSELLQARCAIAKMLIDPRRQSDTTG